MVEVRIIIDPGQEGRPGASDIVVESENDYLIARSRLREARAGDEALTIWVCSEALARRFDDLRGDPFIHVEDYDVRDELATALGVPGIPDLITPDIIRDFDLLSTASRQRRHDGESALSWCLRALLGEAWAGPAPSASDRADILSDLAASERPGLRELFAWRLTAWAASSADSELWLWLADDPFVRARCLLACMAVRGYGDTAVQWLTQAGIRAETAGEAMELLAYVPAIVPVPQRTLHPVIQHQLQCELKTRLDEMGTAAVRAAQARTGAEQRIVLEYLRGRAQDGKLLSEEEGEELTAWSEEAADGPLAQQIALAAALLVETPPPTPLGDAADWEQAAHWLEVEYMPFYLSRAVGNRLEETVEAVAGFEDWLCRTYRSLMEDTKAGLQWFCARGRDVAEDALVVLVLVDGLPLAGMRRLRDALAEEPDAVVASERVYLAPVPTLTPIGKPVLLSARLPDQAQAAEVEALAETFGVQPESCRPIDGIGDLGILFPQQVVLYHYRRVDEDVLHKRMTALDRWLQSYHLMMELADALRPLLRRAVHEGVPLWLGCASDHGWTELPAEASRVDIPDELANDTTHRRVIAGTADDSFGIALPASRFFLSDDYTAARGYTYLGRHPHGAVHGGLTPQEVAVYGFWLTTAPVAATADLILQIAGEVRRAVSRNRALLQLNNPNAEAVVVTAIDLDTVTPMPNGLPLSIEAMAVGDLSVVCDASGCTDMLPVLGTICWHTESGRRCTQGVDFKVPTTGAATTNRDFENMFKV